LINTSLHLATINTKIILNHYFFDILKP